MPFSIIVDNSKNCPYIGAKQLNNKTEIDITIKRRRNCEGEILFTLFRRVLRRIFFRFRFQKIINLSNPPLGKITFFEALKTKNAQESSDEH